MMGFFYFVLMLTSMTFLYISMVEFLKAKRGKMERILFGVCFLTVWAVLIVSSEKFRETTINEACTPTIAQQG